MALRDFEGAGRGFRASTAIHSDWSGEGLRCCALLSRRRSCQPIREHRLQILVPGRLLGRDNIEGPIARELTSIRRSLKIEFLVIGKLANN